MIVSYYAYKWVNGEVSPPYDGIDIDGYSTDPDYAFPQIAPSDILEGNIGENYKTKRRRFLVISGKITHTITKVAYLLKRPKKSDIIMERRMEAGLRRALSNSTLS